MSDTPDTAVLSALRSRQRDLELDAVAVRSRIEEIAELIAMLEHGPRRRPGRPRRPITVINMPDRVEGGIHTEPDEAA